jgi:hypothetical protein
MGARTKSLPARRVTIVAEERGDIHAEPGTHAWAVAVRDQINLAIKDTSSRATFIKSLVELLKQHQGYKSLTGKDGKPFASFEAFCLAPSPYGLGHRPEELNAIILARWAAQHHAETPKPLMLADEVAHLAVSVREKKRNDPDYHYNHNNNDRVKTQGTSSDYLTARIARDRPDILERMKAGEFRSVRQAAIEAGIINPRKRITIAVDPELAAGQIQRHFEPEQITALVVLLGGQNA